MLKKNQYKNASTLIPKILKVINQLQRLAFIPELSFLTLYVENDGFVILYYFFFLLTQGDVDMIYIIIPVNVFEMNTLHILW